MSPSTTAALLEKPSRPAIAPLGPLMGAEVTGVDVARSLTATVAAQLMQALLDYKLLCFRDQLLSTDALLDFAGSWGTPVSQAIESNADEHGRPNGRALDPAALRWRTDCASSAGATATTLLYGVEVPSRGGDMLFCDAAYESQLELATESRFVYRHAWRRHDLLVWDNRCTFHRLTPYDTARDVLTTYCTVVASDRLH